MGSGKGDELGLKKMAISGSRISYSYKIHRGSSVSQSQSLNIGGTQVASYRVFGAIDQTEEPRRSEHQANDLCRPLDLCRSMYLRRMHTYSTNL